MPIPKPKAGQSQDDYISECISFITNEEKKKPKEKRRPAKQIQAICFETWRDSKREAGEFVDGEPIPILRAFESGGKRYVYGYAAIFDSPDIFGTIMTKEAVEASIEHLRKFPAVRFMHRQSLGQIIFDTEIDGVKTFVDDHGFHVLCRIYDECEKEWGMIRGGGWGFSYGFMPATGGGVEKKCLATGKCYDAFVKGTLYEVSVVDTPAHPDAVAYVINRMINSHKGEIMAIERQQEKLGTGGYACKVGDEWKLPIHDAAHVRNAMARYNQAHGCQTSEVKARICAAAKHFGIDAAFEKGGFCYKRKGEKRKMEKADVEKMLQEAEERIIENVTKALEGKKVDATLDEQLKKMEERIMKAVNEKVADLSKKAPTAMETTFKTVTDQVKAMDAKLEEMRNMQAKLTASGENIEGLKTRILELEKQRKAMAENIVASVSKAVEKSVGGLDKRLSAIENIPEFRSPAGTVTKTPVQRGFGAGFRGMLDSAFRGEE